MTVYIHKLVVYIDIMIDVIFIELNLYYKHTLTLSAEAILIFNDKVTNSFYIYPDAFRI